ncbi:hypothetical protein B0G69_7510 [Paraburkholderia sp. RAU2J]|uniref:DUF6723 family protein n=1 Tax=Paraburkholderia sp. RAU2J TaxID=1938810 RepID=UPI000EACC574|nr:DUF6723 family protein [Paraburkholderia sp. RAU2J]RKT14267.1 hypothetical protein B0G69_7510 [Paraburkholderia sp. RAU2J]
MARPKLAFAKLSMEARVALPVSATDYRIYATYRRTGSGAFMGELKVVRTLDDRLLFPFDAACVQPVPS